MARHIRPSFGTGCQSDINTTGMRYSSVNLSSSRAGARLVALFRPSHRLQAVTLEAPFFDGASNIMKVSLSDVESLYVSLSERANDSHVLMVLYAPWCKYCSSMEPEVRKLAKGLEHESDLRIFALDCDAPATRYFAKHVLGTPSLPAFCIFPKHSRSFFKYKGTSRDANSLLKFINMVCNQSDDRLWELSGTDTSTTSPQEGSTILSQSPDSRLISAIGVPAEHVPNVTIAARLLVGTVLLAGAFVILKARQQALSTNPEGTTEVTHEEPRAELSPVQQLVGDIDVTIGRMWGVMVRLVKARVGLSLAPLDDQETKALPQKSASVESNGSLSPPSPPSPPSALAASATPPLPALARPNVSAEQVLAMLDQDGGDVSKTINRMMNLPPGQAPATPR